jgi:hypothetical protein
MTVTNMKQLDRVFNKEHNAIYVTNKRNAYNPRKINSASYAVTKECGNRSMVCKYSCRDDRGGWLAKGNLCSFQSPGREQNYTRKGRRLR